MGELKGQQLLLVEFDSDCELFYIGFELLVFCQLATGQL
jgi:hypothetical protein